MVEAPLSSQLAVVPMSHVSSTVEVQVMPVKGLAGMVSMWKRFHTAEPWPVLEPEPMNRRLRLGSAEFGLSPVRLPVLPPPAS